MSKRKFGKIKSLLHFDYPYFNEPNDGLGDEVSSEVWTREGNTKLAGIEIPYEILRSPKFGYRCAYFPDAESYITGTNTSGIFNLSPDGEYEIEMFVMLDTSTYEILSEQTYNNSKTACENLGGHLATITSQEEENLLKTLVSGTKYSGASFWLGASPQDGRWEWITGENSDYINDIPYYADDNPLSDKATTATYLIMSQINGEWCIEAVSSTTSRYVLCEYESERTLAGNIITIGDIALAVNEVGQITLLSNTSSSALTPKVWHHVLLRLKGRTARVFLDGAEVLSVALPATLSEVEAIRIGGYAGYMDEFVFRVSARNTVPAVPSEPYNGILDVRSVGGFGDGSAGDVISSSLTYVNSSGLINAVTDARTFTVNSWAYSSSSTEYCNPVAGREVMIFVAGTKSTETADYPYLGFYAFGHIAEVNGKSVVLEQAISQENGDDFTLSSELVSSYYVYAIVVPNFKSLTVSKYIAYPLGIVAFRCQGDCIVNANICPNVNSNMTRHDRHQMTHSKLIDRFLCSQYGVVFITCGGRLTVKSGVKIGRSDLTAKPGYGGDGGVAYSGYNIAAYGGSGGVGGGGGGAGYYNSNCTAGGDAGSNATGRGGAGGCGGTAQGVSVHGASNKWYGGGGGAPGGNGGDGWQDNGSSFSGGTPGASVILICRELSIASANIVTNGSNGSNASGGKTVSRSGGAGGGGTGFCYIACERQVSEE